MSGPSSLWPERNVPDPATDTFFWLAGRLMCRLIAVCSCVCTTVVWRRSSRIMWSSNSHWRNCRLSLWPRARPRCWLAYSHRVSQLPLTTTRYSESKALFYSCRFAGSWLPMFYRCIVVGAGSRIRFGAVVFYYLGLRDCGLSGYHLLYTIQYIYWIIVQ